MGKAKTGGTTLLIDGDVVCYRAALRGRETFDWEDGEEPQTLLDFRESLEYIQDFHSEMVKLGVPVYCLSDREWNFRKDLFPGYKAQRDDRARPELLGHCISHIKNSFPFLLYPSLEADDVMGLHSRTAVIVTIDKDLLTVPGHHYNPDHPEEGVFRVGKAEATYRHMLQTLTGDSVDNYKGCPGVGPVKAEKFLGGWETAPKKEKKFQEWRKALWETVVIAYMEKGLTEADALLNARMAYILQPGGYCFETGKITLWLPPQGGMKGNQ